MIVMGIDPGSHITGYGVVKCLSDSTLFHMASGIIRTDPKTPFIDRLKTIHDGVAGLIADHSPEHVAFEDVFYSRNAKSALLLGQARGAAVIAAVKADLEVFVYSPKEIKQAVTGSGNAAKEQVQSFVRQMLKIHLDEQ